MIVAGLDEAGYGPKLGPLVVACTAFSVDTPPGGADAGAPDLWERLAAGVSREPQKDGRVWVADSKQVKPKKDGVRLLELGVLSFLASAGPLPGSLPELLAAVGSAPDLAGAAPWYAGVGTQALPARCWAGEVHTRAARLREAGASAGVRFLGAGARVIPEGQFNARVRATDNKAAVLSEAVVDLLRALRAASPGPLALLVDKQGGRDHYTRLLGSAFPMCAIDPLEEGAQLSAYRVRTPAGPVEVVFRQEAEQHGMAVALASMLAKYLREVFMDQLNAWFQARIPGLSPTAGYALDARRFLADVEPALPRLGVEREELVRAR